MLDLVFFPFKISAMLLLPDILQTDNDSGESCHLFGGVLWHTPKGFCLIYLAVLVSLLFFLFLFVCLFCVFCLFVGFFFFMEVFCLTVATSWSQTLKVTKLEAEVPLNELCECQVKLRL